MNITPRLTISRASRLIRSKLTSQQICAHSLNLAHFGENTLRLNAYIKLLSEEDISEQARASDERIQNGRALSLLDGIPVTIKANVAVGRWWELPTACSAILKNDGGSPNTNSKDETDIYESDIARKLLKECGAVLIGITNMDEFGMGSLGTNNVGSMSHPNAEAQQYSPTYNPLPWMHRIEILQAGKADTSDIDRVFIEQILQSTSSNPHCLSDDALHRLLEEVNYWTSPDKDKIDQRQSKVLLTSPGGSSSGAAVATAHGSSLLSIGTDTGGSLRLPAAWTSTVGFKPTYGSFSRYGVVSYVSSLDTVGFIAGTSECATIAWNCLSKNSAKSCKNNGTTNFCRDSTARIYHANDKSFKKDATETLDNLEMPLDGIRIGIPSAFSLHQTPDLISSTWSKGAQILQNKGATLVSIPDTQVSSQWVKLSCAAYYVLACAEASSNLSRYDSIRYGFRYKLDEMKDVAISDENASAFADMTLLEQQISAARVFGFGDEVQRRVIAGTSVLSSDRFHTHYEAAAIVRAKLSLSLENAFKYSSNASNLDGVDAILVPTALSFPVTLDPVKGAEIDSTSAFANDVMTIPASLGGFPSVSIPICDNSAIENSAELSQTDPRHAVGLQLFGPRGSEDLILKAASVF